MKETSVEKLQNGPTFEQSGDRFTVVDKRSWIQESDARDEAKEEVGGERRRHPTYVEELLRKLEEKDRKLKEFISSYQEEAKKENEAFRSRLSREMERKQEAAKADLTLGFVEVFDNLDRALKSAADHQGTFEKLLNGVKMVEEQFLKQLKSHGIERLERCGKTFDPHLDEALEVIAVGEDRDNLVLEEIEAGYVMGEKLVRPAKVKVGRFTKAQVCENMGPS